MARSDPDRSSTGRPTETISGRPRSSPASTGNLPKPLEDLAQLLAEALAKRWLEEQQRRHPSPHEPAAEFRET